MLNENKQSSLNSKKTFKPILLMVSLTGILFLLSLIYNFNLKIQNKAEDDLPVLLFEEEKYSLPVSISIPQIGIDANIEYVGLTGEGAMDVPKGPAEVAWFKYRARPGEPGTAIMAGHSGWKDDEEAVFDNLYKLKKGDKIYVKSLNGAEVVFVVNKMLTYGPNETVPDVFSSNDGKAHLNLVTCSGIWSKIDKSHSNRLVVFTDKEEAI
ncbi:class F sortase [Candidatus Nomurabacteria bacterium]|nr:class F sortase [Candidatus Nomurabacteria bacterium]